MRKLAERIAEFWCSNMHGQPMWPSRGHYQCRVCLREYPVLFEEAEPARPRREPRFVTPAVAARRA
jgi:hypothetical protein